MEKLLGTNATLQGRPFAVYGAGQGFDTLNQFILRKFNLRPQFVMDQKFTTPGVFQGIPALPMGPGGDTNCLMLISVGSRSAQQTITTALHQLGYRNVLSAFALYEYHLSHAPLEVMSEGEAYYERHSTAINQARSLFHDAESSAVFKQLLHFYRTHEYTALPSHPLSEQYFPTDITFKHGYSRLINGGSFDGDTIRQLVRTIGRIEALACFEPDPINFAKLKSYLATHEAEVAEEVRAFPCGMYDQTTELRFSGSTSVNSSVDEQGDDIVPVVAIDDVLPDFRPTFMNMDIEGSEQRALQGAQQTLRQHAPDLAICLYHTPAQLWEVPLLIKHLNPAYTRFYLRNYTGYPAETVVYATTL